tara:strand:- start:284 stop:790 length:507 start_codon:yes stop_codon:yes gene_type:complete
MKNRMVVMATGTLVFFSGKMGAGKSTSAIQMAHERRAVLLSEDEWLTSLYPDQITSLTDYIHYANLLKPRIKQLVQSILVAGTDVVMDFPANTTRQRDWFRTIFSEIDAPHQLVYMDVSDELCLKQIARRRIEQPERAATDTEAMFQQVTRHFVAPDPGEGFNVVRQD